MQVIRSLAAASGLALCLACSEAPHSSERSLDPEPVAAEDEDLRPRDGDQALEWLLAGNRRFREGRPRHDHESMRRVAMLGKGQHPFATVLGCADSRVAPEMLFDHGLGDMFVIRVAGNVVAEDEAGSIEYSIGHLDVPLIVVLGHERCGAVTAALHATDDEPAELQTLIARVRPALQGISPDLPEEERLRLGVEANVRQSMSQLRAIADRVGRPAEERVRIVGAVYELETGRVRLLDD